MSLIKDTAIGIEILNNAIPYPNQIKDYDINNKDQIRFTWRGTRFKVDFQNASVDEVGNGVLIGSDLSILIEALIKRTLPAYL